MEAELVAIDDSMAQIMWTSNFLEAQRYTIDDNIVFQDNKSAIFLEEQGRASSSQRTRHISVRHRPSEGWQITIKDCPTDQMIGDFSPIATGQLVHPI